MAIGKIIVLALVVLAAAVFAVKMIYGYRKGMGKAILSLLCVLIAAVLTFVFAGSISAFVSRIDISGLNIEVGGQNAGTLEEAAVLAVDSIGGEAGSMGEVLSSSETFMNAVKQVPVLAVAVAVVPLFFILTALILRIVMIFAADPIIRLFSKDKSERPTRTSKFVGLGVGFVCAALICGILFMVPLSLISVTKEAAVKIEKVEPAFTSVSESFIVKAFSAVGFDNLGTAFLRNAANFEAETAEGKKTVYLADEAAGLVELYSLLDEHGVINNGEVASNADAKQYIADSGLVYAAADILKQSDVLKDVVPGVIRYAVAGGAAAAELVQDTKPLSDKDVDDMIDIYRILDESGLTKAIADEDYDRIYAILNDGTTANRLSDAANRSEFARGVITDTIKSAGRTALVKQLAVNNIDTFDLDEFINSIAKEDMDRLYTDPLRDVVVTIAANADLTSYAETYDINASDLDRAAMKCAALSLMEQYDIDMDELLAEARRINN